MTATFRKGAILALILAVTVVAAMDASFEGNLAYQSPFLNLPELAVQPAEHHKRHVLAKRDTPDVDVKFIHGAASGDPLADRVILWTKVTPSTTKFPVKVNYEVSADRTFAADSIVKSGSVLTTDDVDWTVKVDVDGLKPQTTYFYRFFAGNAISRVGRTKTLPTPDTPVDMVRVAAISCSSMPHGYFHAHARIAEREDIDLVLELGDYIYEHPESKPIKSGKLGGERAPQPSYQTFTLSDYRTRHSQYKRDKDTQALHLAHPMASIADDHETIDNASRDGAPKHDPKTQGDWKVRMAASTRAYFEYMPIRNEVDKQQYRMYRTFRFGNMADIIFADSRYDGRDLQAVGDINKRKIMSDKQEAWFHNELVSSKAKYRVIANQVMFAPIPHKILGYEIEITSDAWVGYPYNRNRLLNLMATKKLNDSLILTGDLHSSIASNIYSDSLPYNKESGEGALMTEFVGPSVTSESSVFDNKVLSDMAGPVLKLVNKGAQWTDFYRHGYMVLQLTNEFARTEYWYVQDIKKLDGGREILGVVLESKRGSNRITKKYSP
ncbi:hypothetical protein H9P43_005892 [Blastocladiella emersonii ATCC 22665]|nr:hypothetical protein H9P43_005892 [Blastocladiella emersonii ATCC 22665]